MLFTNWATNMKNAEINSIRTSDEVIGLLNSGDKTSFSKGDTGNNNLQNQKPSTILDCSENISEQFKELMFESNIIELKITVTCFSIIMIDSCD